MNHKWVDRIASVLSFLLVPFMFLACMVYGIWVICFGDAKKRWKR